MNDGSTINSYFGIGNAPNGDDVANQGLRFLIGQVDKIHFTDEQSNLSKKFLEYDVSVRDAHGGQSTYRNVRQMSSFFGFNNYDETVLEPNDAALSGKLDTSNFFTNKNGTLVVIAFLNGSQDKPIIIGSVTHPRFKGAVKADGIRRKGEFNGFKYEINKEGEMLLTYTGNKKPNGTPVRASTGPTVVKIDKNGVFSIVDNKQQTFKIDRTNKTISFTNGTTVKFDGQTDQITLQTTKGTKIVVDGNSGDKISMTTSAGAKAEVDGQSNTILLKDNGTGSLKISNSKVALGASSAELLDQISKALQEVITFANTESAHVHTGNLGYPTSPPSTMSNWTALGSALSSIKGLIDGIKGSL